MVLEPLPVAEGRTPQETGYDVARLGRCRHPLGQFGVHGVDESFRNPRSEKMSVCLRSRLVEGPRVCVGMLLRGGAAEGGSPAPG